LVLCEPVNAEALQIVLTGTPIVQAVMISWHRVKLPDVHTLNKMMNGCVVALDQPRNRERE
jgi:hypothetical protein